MRTNKYVIGILAHANSGKTTLAESILFKSGSIRKFGRVDHKDAFLDNYDLERKRGITIFSKQAQLNIGSKEICILDTPGHVDFSAEMERTLQVLDYAVLVVNGAEGVQEHTKTLWRLLKRYNIPVFLFINKMDQPNTNKTEILSELMKQLDSSCIDFCDCMNPKQKFYDDVAMCDENLMNEFLEYGRIEKEDIKNAIAQRKIFPCLFGSALKQQGISELLEILDCFMKEKDYPDEFGARVFKITHDEKDNRLTHMKILGGTLKVKTMLSDGNWYEKVDQIRIYSGNQYKSSDAAMAGSICAVMGLNNTFSGEGLGFIKEIEFPFLEPVLTYKLFALKDCTAHELYSKLCVFEEEDPQLHIIWNEQLNEIQVQVMGEIQIEVLKDLIFKKFHIDVSFGTGDILYKETITEPVIGIGHFEPLKHYAEVHLLMEPLERGNGLEFVTNCSEGILDKNWQQQILKYLEEKKHIGVLTGAEITDMKISVIAGKNHQKHTEGEDFRQAACRAVRNGMKKAKSVLLEPFYEFHLEVPQEFVGRAMTDIQHMFGKFEMPIIENGMAILKGTAPVACMQGYQIKINSYSSGKGKIFYTINGYDLCHNMDEIISEKKYDSENDANNPTGSIFCSHGAGYYVKWDKVVNYAHIDSRLTNTNNSEQDIDYYSQYSKRTKSNFDDTLISQEEVNEIFKRMYRNTKKKTGWSKTINSTKDNGYNETKKSCQYIKKDEYLLVDGYNIIFAWEELNKLSKVNINSAREKLMDILCNYQGYKKLNIILVFDAYKVHGGKEEMFNYHNIHVVYTKETETADQYIEKITNEIGKKYSVTVATSDKLEQMIVWGQGARRLSALELLHDVEQINEEIRDVVKKNNHMNRSSKERYMHISE